MQFNKKQFKIGYVLLLIILSLTILTISLERKINLEILDRVKDIGKTTTIFAGTFELAPAGTASSETILNSMVEIEEEKQALKSLGTFKLSAYCPCVKCCGIWSDKHPSRIGTDFVQKTASETIPTSGRTVGVDPEVIALGTVIYINGSEYVAEDTGTGVCGNHIDIFFETHDEACAFGIQKAKVYMKN